MSKRNPRVLGVWGPLGARPVAAESYWRGPLRWNEAARKAGVRRRVFCLSLGDFFEGRSDLDNVRMRTFDLVQRTPFLDWLFLTKRPELIELTLRRLRNSSWDYPAMGVWCDRWIDGHSPPNVWLGTSVENEGAAARIHDLRDCLAALRFLSIEPLIGPLDLRGRLDGIGWVIVGGESGAKARPCDVGWIRGVGIDAKSAGVPLFVKQLGSSPRLPGLILRDSKGGDIDEWPRDLRVREIPTVK